MTITRELYDAFQRVEIDRWDAIIAEDVLTNSPGGLGIKGRAPLKAWAGAFASALAYQIDLVDDQDYEDRCRRQFPRPCALSVGQGLAASPQLGSQTNHRWSRPPLRCPRQVRCCSGCGIGSQRTQAWHDP
jgi:hypothetical protein